MISFCSPCLSWESRVRAESKSGVELAAVPLRTARIPHSLHNNNLLTVATYKFKVHPLNRLNRLILNQIPLKNQPTFVMKLLGVLALAFGAGIGEYFKPHHTLIPGI